MSAPGRRTRLETRRGHSRKRLSCPTPVVMCTPRVDPRARRDDGCRMNFLGHAHVALGLGADDGTTVLGAVVADLAAMAGVRVRRSDAVGALADGMWLYL